MDPTVQQYLMYALFTVLGALVKHFFPQIVPLPTPAPAPPPPPPTLGLTMVQLEAMLDAAIKRNISGIKLP